MRDAKRRRVEEYPRPGGYDRAYDDRRYDERAYDERRYDERAYDDRAYDRGYDRAYA